MLGKRYLVGTLHRFELQCTTEQLDTLPDLDRHYVHEHDSMHRQMHELVIIIGCKPDAASFNIMTAGAMLSRLLQMVMQKAIPRTAQQNSGAGLAGT